MANILMLYNQTQTYTETVYENLCSFAEDSVHDYYFTHVNEFLSCEINVHEFDAICIHYCIRLPMSQFSQSWAEAIRGFDGFKFLFIQDEYDYTNKAKEWIKFFAFDMVFTVVPEPNIHRIYPPEEFPKTKFVNVLTGYVPKKFENITTPPLPSKRHILCCYRGRPLPAVYGALGAQKVKIGVMVKEFARRNNLKVDIAWTEKDRIYGSKWYEFIAAARSTLGTESGSNIFDWDGDLRQKLDDARLKYPDCTDAELLTDKLGISEEHGLMNQVSPRVFESIALRTALVLFPGNYSYVLEPGKHYITLEKDGSNLEEVFAKLVDGQFLDRMVEQAYRDVIETKRYSYETFQSYIDRKIDLLPIRKMAIVPRPILTRSPVKHPAPGTSISIGLIKRVIHSDANERVQMIYRTLAPIAVFIPKPIYRRLKPFVRKLIGL